MPCGSRMAAATLARLRRRRGALLTEAHVDSGHSWKASGRSTCLIVLYFIGFFVLGFAQGTIRRLLGIASILFSWFLAATCSPSRCRTSSARTGRSSRRSTATWSGSGRSSSPRRSPSRSSSRASTSRSRCSRRRASPTRSSAASSASSRRRSSSGRVLIILDSFFRDPGHPARTRRSCRSCATSGPRSTARRSPSSSATP